MAHMSLSTTRLRHVGHCLQTLGVLHKKPVKFLTRTCEGLRLGLVTVLKLGPVKVLDLQR